MSADLLQRLRASRETWVTIDRFDFLVRRPTDVQLVRTAGRSDADFLRECLVGWRNVRTVDVVPGGDDAPAPFDIETAIEWLEDRADLFPKLLEAIVAVLNARVQRLADAEKK